MPEIYFITYILLCLLFSGHARHSFEEYDKILRSFPCSTTVLNNHKSSDSSNFEYEDKSILPLPRNELQYHGTTTLAFLYKDGVIVAIDSRASIGNYVGSQTVKKIFPISKSIIATMAGGAADCSYWIRLIGRQIKIYEQDLKISFGVRMAARLLARNLRELRDTGD